MTLVAHTAGRLGELANAIRDVDRDRTRPAVLEYATLVAAGEFARPRSRSLLRRRPSALGAPLAAIGLYMVLFPRGASLLQAEAGSRLSVFTSFGCAVRHQGEPSTPALAVGPQ